MKHFPGNLSGLATRTSRHQENAATTQLNAHEQNNLIAYKCGDVKSKTKK